MSGLLPFGTLYLTGFRTPELDAASRFNMENANTAWEKMPIGFLIQPKTEGYLDEDTYLKDVEDRKTGRYVPQIESFGRAWDYYEYVGIDNGCFTEAGRRRYSDYGYFKLIEKTLEIYGDNVLFATARDVPEDWEGTLKISLPLLPKIRALGAQAAIVLQDGATPATVPWDEFDSIFIGGSTEWKLGDMARAITKEAVRRQKWPHMGRVNSMSRMRIAQSFGCRSADGTYLLHEALKGNIEQGIEDVINWCRAMWQEDSSRESFRWFFHPESLSYK